MIEAPQQAISRRHSRFSRRKTRFACLTCKHGAHLRCRRRRFVSHNAGRVHEACRSLVTARHGTRQGTKNRNAKETPGTTHHVCLCVRVRVCVCARARMRKHTDMTRPHGHERALSHGRVCEYADATHSVHAVPPQPPRLKLPQGTVPSSVTIVSRLSLVVALVLRPLWWGPHLLVWPFHDPEPSAYFLNRSLAYPLLTHRPHRLVKSSILPYPTKARGSSPFFRPLLLVNLSEASASTSTPATPACTLLPQEQSSGTHSRLPPLHMPVLASRPPTDTDLGLLPLTL